MGTSSSYRGSAGQGWSNARRAARELGSTPAAASARRAAAAAAAALAGWDDAAAPDAVGPEPSILPLSPGSAEPSRRPRTDAAPTPVLLVPGTPGGRGGAGGRGGGGGGDSSGRAGGGGGRIRLGSFRSTRRAARAASRIASAAYALRAGDTAALARLGIDAAALAGRSPRHQCQVILNAILDLPRTPQEQELQAACADTLLRMLGEPELSALDVVRIFVGSYLFEILAVELAAAFRENGDGTQQERVLRDTIDAAVGSALTGVDGHMTTDQLETVIGGTLERTRRIMQGRRR